LVGRFWDFFAMLNSIGQDAKRKRLGVGDGFVATDTVANYAGQSGHFRNPAAIFFAI
jgi:hypothetical protein